MALDSFFSNSVWPGGSAGVTPVTAPPVGQTYGTGLEAANSRVTGALTSMLDPNSSYIQNARRRGLEHAAQRGGINSSIAAGSSERAALEAAMPLVQQSLEIDAQRENVGAQDWLAQQGLQREEWLTQQNFNRAMMGQYGQAAFQSTLGMLQSVQQYALEDPELYTPDVVSGYSDFFSQNFDNILSRYFGNRG